MRSTPSPLYIFGGDSTALEIAEAADAGDVAGHRAVYFVVPDDELPDGQSRLSVSKLACHIDDTGPGGYILSMADQSIRARCDQTARNAGLRPMSVIHPTAVISPSAQLGDGVYVAAFSVVSSLAIVADHAMVNFQCLVGHHSRLDQHAMLNPGARVGGRCRIGCRSMIGANAFVHQGKCVGDDVIIDAMTYVDRDIESGHIFSCRSKNGRPLRRPFFARDASEPIVAQSH